MAKIVRATQKIFGSTAGSNQIAEFGSLAAGGFTGGSTYDGTTITAAIVQTLSNYLEGWFAAVDGEFNPAIEDVNAIDWLFSRQLAYLMQAGVQEWDSATTYYIGSIASDGLGNLYYSLIDSNLNHALSVTTDWRKITGPATVQTKSSAYNILAGDNLIRVTGTTTVTLPDATLNTGTVFTIKNVDGSALVTTVATTSAQTIDGASTYSLPEQFQFVRVQSNGTNWDIIGW